MSIACAYHICQQKNVLPLSSSWTRLRGWQYWALSPIDQPPGVQSSILPVLMRYGITHCLFPSRWAGASIALKSSTGWILLPSVLHAPHSRKCPFIQTGERLRSRRVNFLALIIPRRLASPTVLGCPLKYIARIWVASVWKALFYILFFFASLSCFVAFVALIALNNLMVCVFIFDSW